ncbi:MAG: pyruvate kinase [Chloroflexota bacterium]
MERRTKIVVTLGPASQDETILEQLILAGMDVARLNFSHGTHQEHGRMIRDLRRLSQQLGKPVTIMQDLQGPKIRVKEITGGQVEVQANQHLKLTTKDIVGDQHQVAVDFSDLPRNVAVGGRILIDDGQIELRVTDIGEDSVDTHVVIGGTLRSNKGVNLPGAILSVPSFTDKDRADLEFGLGAEIDVVAISFVCCAKDITAVCEAISKHGAVLQQTPTIAKLERPEAVENLQEILQVSDGVMVARGDLGVEMPPESVPITQKRIIEAANQQGKVVITATQMLDSMVYNPRPTRAEATDVANAIFDGTDAVMLSAETASGKYPLQAVKMMDAIVRQAEAHLEEWGHWNRPAKEINYDDASAITRAAWDLAHDRDVAAIAVFTQSGRTARLMSKARPRVPIFAFTPEPRTYHRLGLYWGVIPMLVPFSNTVEDMLSHVEEVMMSATPVQAGQQVVMISGFPVGAMRPPNLALLHTIGEQK